MSQRSFSLVIGLGLRDFEDARTLGSHLMFVKLVVRAAIESGVVETRILTRILTSLRRSTANILKLLIILLLLNDS